MNVSTRKFKRIVTSQEFSLLIGTLKLRRSVSNILIWVSRDDHNERATRGPQVQLSYLLREKAGLYIVVGKLIVRQRGLRRNSYLV